MLVDAICLVPEHFILRKLFPVPWEVIAIGFNNDTFRKN
jgi:hypothetical protein